MDYPNVPAKLDAGQVTAYNVSMSTRDYRVDGASELVEQGSTRMPPTAQLWLSPVGVRPTEDGIEWLPRESLIRRGVIAPSEGLLEEFLALRGAHSQLVADFAMRHGVLGLSDKMWPRAGEYTKEPLSAWHELSDRAEALLTAAVKLRARQPLSDDQRVPVLRAAWPDVAGTRFTARELYLDGEPFFEPHPDPEAALREALLLHSSRTLEDDRVQLAWAVSTWMQEAGAHLVLAWPTGATAPTLTIGGEMARGCLPAIAVQVALACARADTTRACDGCGALHGPRRQPKPGQRSFCQQCRDAGVPVRLANRDRRARQRQTKIGATSP